MQERRTTVRVGFPQRVQYCASEDLAPRDGRVTTLSERGLGLLAHEGHKVGERITVSFSLSGDEAPFTTTGVVRWSSPAASHQQWHSVGLEWLTFDGATRHRMDRFIHNQAQVEAGPQKRTVALRQKRLGLDRTTWKRGAFLSVALIGVLAVVVLYGQVRSLDNTNARLSQVIRERGLMIDGLEARVSHFEHEFQMASTAFTQTAFELEELDRQARHFQKEIESLTQEVNRSQDAYAAVRSSRDQLSLRVGELERERDGISQTLSSVTSELTKIRQESIASQINGYSRWRFSTHAPSQGLLPGNRGYLIREGWSTLGKIPVRIRVHEPK